MKWLPRKLPPAGNAAVVTVARPLASNGTSAARTLLTGFRPSRVMLRKVTVPVGVPGGEPVTVAVNVMGVPTTTWRWSGSEDVSDRLTSASSPRAKRVPPLRV